MVLSGARPMDQLIGQVMDHPGNEELWHIVDLYTMEMPCHVARTLAAAKAESTSHGFVGRLCQPPMIKRRFTETPYN